MSFENIIKDSNYHQSSTADYGFRVLTDGTSVEGESFRSIQALNAAAVVSATSAVGDSLNSITIPKGGVILGKFTQISVTGTVIAYLAS